MKTFLIDTGFCRPFRMRFASLEDARAQYRDAYRVEEIMTLDECHDCGKAYERRYVDCPYATVIADCCSECDEIRADKHEPDYDAPSAETARVEALDVYTRLK